MADQRAIIPKKYYEASLELSDREWRVLTVLFLYLNQKTYTCFPSRKVIGQLSGGISPEEVYEAANSLMNKGYIKIWIDSTKKGYRHTVYSVTRKIPLAENGE